MPRQKRIHSSRDEGNQEIINSALANWGWGGEGIVSPSQKEELQEPE